MRPRVRTPPPCSRRTRGGKREMLLGPPMAACSPVGGGGRLFPATLESESTGEMVEVPVRMPAHSRASTPSCGGREGIGTGVSRRPEGNWRIPSFLYYSYRRKGNNTPKPSTARAGRFLSLFQARANDAMTTPPPPRWVLGIADTPPPSQRRGGLWIRSYPQHAKKRKKGS